MEFPGKTLYDLVLCIQFYLKKKGIFWKLVDDPDFVRLKFTIDNLMKKRAGERLASSMVSEAISFDQEEILWKSNVLGEQNADQLRCTVLYLISLSFALHGGDEHRRLRCLGFDPQISVLTDEKGVKYLSYTEDTKSKTNQGGLAGRKHKPKAVNVYGNSVNSDRDLVRLYEKYIALLPSNPKCSALYKYSLSSGYCTPKCWFTDKPVGVNSLKKVVSNMMKDAGIEGCFTNHSLRASTAMRMFRKGVDEQLIKQVTGHKSDAVRLYKRPSSSLLDAACKTVVEKESDMSTTLKKQKLSEQKSVPEPKPFDIDDYEIHPSEKVTYKVSESKFGDQIHKKGCCVGDEDGKCGGLCDVLKKLDEKVAKVKVKKVRLSLKLKK